MRLQSCFALAASLICLQPGVAQQPSTRAPRMTVLVTATTEVDRTASATGAATRVGGVAVGSAGGTSSVYEHSEIWEVVRRLTEVCPEVTFVTDPQTAHNLTIHTDYQKVHSTVMGTLVLYQLVLLDSSNNPLLVTKKNWLRREVKPMCKAIEQQKVVAATTP